MTYFDILERLDPEIGNERVVWRFRVSIPPLSPFFTGHFERQPVLPAMAQLALVQELVEERLAAPVSIVAIKKARFRTPVGPSDVLDVVLSQLEGSDRLRFSMKLGHNAVSEGLLTVRVKGSCDVLGD